MSKEALEAQNTPKVSWAFFCKMKKMKKMTTQFENELLKQAINGNYCLSEYFTSDEIALLIPTCKKLIHLGLIFKIILYGDVNIYLTQKGRDYINHQA
jgi:hypothetical protein